MPGYQGVHKREENRGLKVEWRVAMRPGKRRRPPTLRMQRELVKKAKASVRAKSLPRPRSMVEHPFLKMKRLFGYGKSLPSRKRGVRYRGLAKDAERPPLLFGLGNLLTA